MFFDRVWLHIDDLDRQVISEDLNAPFDVILDRATRQMITEIEDQPRNADSDETSGENRKPASSGGFLAGYLLLVLFLVRNLWWSISDSNR